MLVTRGYVPARKRSVATTEQLGRASAASVLRTVLMRGPIPRAHIADQIGVNRATVTRVSNRLIDLGLIREVEPRRDNPGRPMVPLALAGEDRLVISAHFGAHESRVGVVDLHGRVLAEDRDRYSGRDPEPLVATVADRISAAAGRFGSRGRVLGVGASIGGWIRPETGDVVRFEPLDWEHVPLAALLSAAVDLPLHFDQVVRGLAVAERLFGAARGMDDFLELWIGSVVGAAIVHDGELYRGPNGTAGSIAHMAVRGAGSPNCECGRRGCLVQTVSNDAVVAEAVRGGIMEPGADLNRLRYLAEAGVDKARQLVADVAALTGDVAAGMAGLLDPAALVVAGPLTAVPGYLDALRAAVVQGSAGVGDVDVRASAFGDLAPTIASAAVLLDDYLRDPLGFESLA